MKTPIESAGGWGEVYCNCTSKTTLHGGYGICDDLDSRTKYLGTNFNNSGMVYHFASTWKILGLEESLQTAQHHLHSNRSQQQATDPH